MMNQHLLTVFGRTCGNFGSLESNENFLIKGVIYFSFFSTQKKSQLLFFFFFWTVTMRIFQLNFGMLFYVKKKRDWKKEKKISPLECTLIFFFFFWLARGTFFNGQYKGALHLRCSRVSHLNLFVKPMFTGPNK